MPSKAARELPCFSQGSLILEARRVPREISSDLIIYWSTEISPYDFIAKCQAVVHAPGFLTHIEIVADQDIMTVDELSQLRHKLQKRSLVRFNVADWSVTWMKQSGNKGAEIQAVVGKVPNAMTDMVKHSIQGFSSKRVDAFFEQLRAII